MSNLTMPTAVVERDWQGNPKVKDPQTGRTVVYKRVTTYIDVLEDKYLLNLWSQRAVAAGLAKRHDLIMQTAAAIGGNPDINDPDTRKELNAVTKAAREAGGATEAATIGSAVHALTHQIDRGLTPLVPPAAKPDIEAYKQGTAHLTMLEAEVFVVHDGYQVGGTFDRIAELNGQQYVADIKTGRIDYGASKIAMQLALYAASQHYDPRTGRRESLDVDQTRGIVIHLPATQAECILHWADLQAGREGLEVARQVWAWRGRQELLNATPPRPNLERLIAGCDSYEALVAVWAANLTHWDNQATLAAEARKQALNGAQVSSPATAG